MAYLVDLRTVCYGCRRADATKELRNRTNEPMGFYCLACSHERLAALQERESAGS